MKTLIALLVAAVALPLGANAAAGGGSSGTLDINTQVASGYRIGRDLCPPGTPSTTRDCVQFQGAAGIPGLGRASITYVKAFDDTICLNQVTQPRTATIDVPGKGRITVAMDYPTCSDVAPSSVVIGGTVAEATGAFAGASGRFRFSSSVGRASCGAGGCSGGSSDSWTGTLAVAGMEFDLTPPVFQPAAARRVTAPRKATTVRVRYALKAQDAVDGALPALCKPSSGSRFKVGRTTTVSCTAEDRSANVAGASFKVIVARSRR
jgi:HYR domain